MKEVKCHVIDVGLLDTVEKIEVFKELIYTTDSLGANLDEANGVTHVLYKDIEQRNAAYEAFKDRFEYIKINKRTCFIDKKYLDNSDMAKDKKAWLESFEKRKAAEQKAFEMAAIKEQEHQKLKGTLKELEKCLEEFKVRDEMRKKEMEKTRIAHETLVKALNKEIRSLEHRLKEMEEQRLFPDEISEDEKLAYTEQEGDYHCRLIIQMLRQCVRTTMGLEKK